jgi:N-acyl homoserine lactone hydrolase
MEIKRLDLGHLFIAKQQWPVHGYVILHDELGVVLVDSGCGGPDEVLRYYEVVNRTVAHALADHDLSPIDVTIVVNTHLHFDHCGQNPAFAHAPLMVQRAEHERMLTDHDEVGEWIEASGMQFELIDGDTQLAADLRIVTSPGHTSGHQSVVATTDAGTELFIGDAAYTRAVWEHAGSKPLPEGQAADLDTWRTTLTDLKSLAPARIHFCHDR